MSSFRQTALQHDIFVNQDLLGQLGIFQHVSKLALAP